MDDFNRELSYNYESNSNNKKEKSHLDDLIVYINKNTIVKEDNNKKSVFILIIFLLVSLILFAYIFGVKFLSSYIVGILTSGVLLLSVILTLIFSRYNLEVWFFNFILLLLALIFFVGKGVDILFNILSIVILLYFIYLSVKRSKNFVIGVIVSFFIILFSFKYYFPFVKSIEPSIEKSSKITSYHVKNAVLDSLLSSVNYAFLPLISPDEYSKRLFKENLKAKENELPSIGEYNNIEILGLITPSSDNTVQINSYEGSFLISYLFKYDKKFSELMNFLRLPSDVKNTTIKISCKIINEENEVSGNCKINNRSVLVRNINYIEKKEDFKINFKIFSRENTLLLFNEINTSQIAAGILEQNKIKAVQFKTPLSISAKFVKINDNRLYHYSGFIYFIDRYKSGSFLEDEPIKTDNFIEKLNKIYFCFDKVNNRNLISDFFVVNGFYKKKLDPVEIENKICYILDKNVSFDNIKSYQIDFYTSEDLDYYLLNFYILVPFTYKKIAYIKLISNYYLLPFVYFNKLDNFYNTPIIYLKDYWSIKNEEVTFLSNLYNSLRNMSLNEKSLYLLNNDDYLRKIKNKKSVFALLLLDYLRKEYGLSEVSICTLFANNISNCIETVKQKINRILSKEYDILIKKLNKCVGLSTSDLNTKMIINLFDYLNENSRDVVSCKKLIDIYNDNTFDEIINDYENLVSYLIAKYNNI